MRKLIILCLLLAGCPEPPATNSYPTLPTPPTGTVSTTAHNTSLVAPLSSGVAVSIVLDTSGSMSGQPLESVKQILLGPVIEKLSYYKMANNGNLDVALIECGDDARVVIPMGEFNGDRFQKAVHAIDSRGGTPLGASVFSAYEQLSHSERTDRHIFVLTDGQTGDYEPATVMEQMASRGGETVSVHLIGFNSNKSYYAEMEKQGAQVIMVGDADTLETTTTLIFEKGILKLEADD